MVGIFIQVSHATPGTKKWSDKEALVKAME